MLFTLLFQVIGLNTYAQNNKVNDTIMKIHEYTDGANLISDKYKFYAFGSFHGHKSAFEIFVEQLKHLYYTANTRIIFEEYSYHTCYILNHYIQTGEKSDYFMMYVYKNDLKYLYMPIYQLNKILPDSSKIKIIGVEHNYLTTNPDVIYALQLLLPKKKNIPQEIIEAVNPLKNFAYNSETISRDSLLHNLIESFHNNRQVYEEYLGAQNYQEFDKMIRLYFASKSIPYTGKMKIDSVDFTIREEFIYSRLVEEINNYPESNYIGLFGCFHTVLDTGILYNNSGKITQHVFYSFIARLNKEVESPVRNDVCATVILEDYSVFGRALKYRVGNKTYKKIKKMTKNGKTYLISFKPGEGEGGDIATKKFQYVFFVR